MAKARPETIILKGDPIMSEAEAHEAITPGSLIKRDADGQVSNQVDGTNDEAPATFAKENDIGGDDLTHPYAVGEVVQFFTAYPGYGSTSAIGSQCSYYHWIGPCCRPRWYS